MKRLNHLLRSKFAHSLGICAALPLVLAPLQSADFETATSGSWNGAGVWSPEGNPQTGSTDSALILHSVVNTGTAVGLSGSNDWGVSGGQTVTIDGGMFTHTQPGWWQRVGHAGEGTVLINDGEWFFVNNTGGGGAQLQVGIRGGTGNIVIGDGVGAAGTAILDLFHSDAFLTQNGASIQMNLGASEGGFASNSVGTVTINSDGRFEGDADATVRIAQSETSQGTWTINEGGVANIRGQFEIAVNNGSIGNLTVTGAGALLDQALQDSGTFNIGYNSGSQGSLSILNGGVVKSGREMLFGRNGGSQATILIDGAGSRLENSQVGGGNSDFRIAQGGQALMTIQNGGSVVRTATGKWAWVGQSNGSNGELRILSGGSFTNADNAEMRVGNDSGATGKILVDGGTYTNPFHISIGNGGNGTYHQISGSTSIGADLTLGLGGGTGQLTVDGGTLNTGRIRSAANSGTANINLNGGTVNVNSGAFYLGTGAGQATLTVTGGTLNANNWFVMGGEALGSAGPGTSIVNQNGGVVNLNSVSIIGFGVNHNSTYNLNAGVLNHTADDMSVSEGGTGLLHIAEGAEMNSSATGQFYVGRNAGSHGTLIVDGVMNRTAGSAIRVGDANITGTGVLGGTGVLTSANGVRIGSAGTITGSTLLGVGNLSINGNLSFATGGTYNMDFTSAGAADLLTINGTIDLTGSVLDLDWVSGAPTGIQTRYWAILNDESDAVTGAFSNAGAAPVGFTDLFPTADGWITEDGQIFAVFYGGDYASGSLTGGNDVLLVAIPEPGRALTAALALAAAGIRRRRTN